MAIIAWDPAYDFYADNGWLVDSGDTRRSVAWAESQLQAWIGKGNILIDQNGSPTNPITWLSLLLPIQCPYTWSDYQAGGDGTGTAPKGGGGGGAKTPTISVSPTTIKQGNYLVITAPAGAFTPGGQVKIVLSTDAYQYGAVAGSNGSLDYNALIDAGVPSGEYLVYAVDQTSGAQSNSVPIEVVIKVVTPSISISPTTVTQGKSVTITSPAGSWDGNSGLSIFIVYDIDTSVEVSGVAANADGSFSKTLTIGSNISAGTWGIYVQETPALVSNTVNITVNPPPITPVTPVTPVTPGGTTVNYMPYVLGGLAIVGIGVAAIALKHK